MKIIIKCMLFAFAFALSFSVFSKEPTPFVKDDLFIGGYDPVSYLRSLKAQKGSKDLKANYKGVVILFSSQENRKLFLESPEKYWPQYNGYCAYALAEKAGLVEINPETFKVIKGKTYLFYNDSPGWFSVNTLDKWNKKSDIDQVKAANQEWLKTRNK